MGPNAAAKVPEWTKKLSTNVELVSPLWVQPVKSPVSKPPFTTRFAALATLEAAISAAAATPKRDNCFMEVSIEKPQWSPGAKSVHSEQNLCHNSSVNDLGHFRSLGRSGSVRISDRTICCSSLNRLSADI